MARGSAMNGLGPGKWLGLGPGQWLGQDKG